jgi:hypothetical protein
MTPFRRPSRVAALASSAALGIPLLSAVPAHADMPLGSFALLLSVELGDRVAPGFGFDFRFGAILDDQAFGGSYSDAISGSMSFAYIGGGGFRFIAALDYSEQEGDLGSGLQLGWFFRGRSYIGPETHGLALGVFLRPQLQLEVGTNAFLSLDELGLSANAWFAGRLNSATESQGMEGRPLHIDGVLAPVPWVLATHGRPSIPDPSLAAHWRRAAQAERGSVTTFHELATDLASLDAPASLVRAARRAAQEEHRHADLAESIAARHGPAFATAAPPLPKRPSESVSQRLERLALEAVNDGLLNESIAARDALVAAQTCRTATTRDALRLIARDEQTHADLAAATLSFVLERARQVHAPHLRDHVAQALANPRRPLADDRPDAGGADGVNPLDRHLALARDTVDDVSRRLLQTL